MWELNWGEKGQVGLREEFKPVANLPLPFCDSKVQGWLGPRRELATAVDVGLAFGQFWLIPKAEGSCSAHQENVGVLVGTSEPVPVNRQVIRFSMLENSWLLYLEGKGIVRFKPSLVHAEHTSCLWATSAVPRACFKYLGFYGLKHSFREYWV